MNPIVNNLISRSGFGKRTSLPDFCDNSPIGDIILDALDTFPPEDGLDQLKRLRKEVDAAIVALEGSSKAWDAPNAPPRQVRAGILENPYRGLVDAVDWKDIPARKGGLVRTYKIRTGAAMFETYDRNAAAVAYRAIQAGKPVAIKWKPRQNGKYMNYDIVAVRVLDPHGEQII